MKSYIVDRSSSTPKLNEMPTNVEKIYPTKEAAETALANGDIADGEFVSTVDTVTDEGDKFDKSYLSYSTEETLTGGTWIDGKPIYRKVIVVNQAAPATIPTGLTNVEFIDVRVKANYQTGTATTGQNQSFYVSNELNNQVGGQPYYFGAENVLWKVTSGFTGYVYWVILEYTKQ